MYAVIKYAQNGQIYNNLIKFIFGKLVVPQPVRKSPAFCGTRSFITVFTHAHANARARTRTHTNYPYSEPHKSNPLRPISFLYYSFLYYYHTTYVQVFQVVSFLHVSPPKSCMYLCAPFPSQEHPNNTWWKVQIMKPLIMQISPSPYPFLSLRHKFLPQRPIFANIQPVLFPLCQSP